MAWSTGVLFERCATEGVVVVAAAAAPLSCATPELDGSPGVTVPDRRRGLARVGLVVVVAAGLAALVAVVAVLGDGPDVGGSSNGPRRVRLSGSSEGARAPSLAAALAAEPPVVRTRTGRWLVRTADELVLAEQVQSWGVRGREQHLVLAWRCPLAELTGVTGRVELGFADGSSVNVDLGRRWSRRLRKAFPAPS